MFIKIHSF